MMRVNDARARNHPAYWAFLVHRISGLLLALFLPLHFWALGRVLQGQAALDGFLRYTDAPLFKLAEWGLAVLLSLHLMGGLRLLAIEFLPWRGMRKDLLAAMLGVGLCVGLAFLLALLD
jgi:fumarate reductase subunit D